MKYRKRRIAWSVAWGIFCLLLIALWVRSYYGRIGFEILVTNSYRYEVHSLDGKVLGVRWVRMYAGKEFVFPRSEAMYDELNNYVRWGAGYYGFAPSVVVIPYWLLTSLTILTAGIPWIRWRFSLRTLLIAATVVAVGLGVAVMMLRGS
jgi:hypothetical protein